MLGLSSKSSKIRTVSSRTPSASSKVSSNPLTAARTFFVTGVISGGPALKRGLVAIPRSASNGALHPAEERCLFLEKLLEEKSENLRSERQLMTQLLESLHKQLEGKDKLLQEKENCMEAQRRQLEEQLISSTTSLLGAKGLLSMRGLMEWAEAKFRMKYKDAVSKAQAEHDAWYNVAVGAAKKEKATKKDDHEVQDPQPKGKQKRTKKGNQQPAQKLEEEEHKEEAYCASIPRKKSRRELLWEVILAAELSLQDCIVVKTGWKADEIPSRLDALYALLSNKIQKNTQISLNKVDLVVAVASEHACLALECIGQSVNVRTVII